MWRLVILAVILAASSAEAANPCGKGTLTVLPSSNTYTLHLHWVGTIREPLHERIASEFQKGKGRTKEVILGLESCGGSLTEVDKVAGVLRRIKESHQLTTIVGRGALCASACIPIFMQGHRRLAALTSSWLFHEIGRMTGKEHSRVKVDRTKTEMMFQDYFLPAGVSETWLNQLRIRVQHANYWQTGENLWKDKSGIITEPIDNLAPRGTEEWRY